MPNIRHELLIAVSAEKVYNAITSQEGLAAWWAPDTKATAELNSVARFSFGPVYFKEMKITELQPFELVTWLCIAGADEWIGTIISFTLIPVDKATGLKTYSEIGGQLDQQSNDSIITLLRFQHDDWKAYTPMFAECSYTWAQFLRSLKLFCETGKGKPFPNQHSNDT